jgi:hypothetical protein
MLCDLGIGIMGTFAESGLGRYNNYIMKGFFYVERTVRLRRGGSFSVEFSSRGPYFLAQVWRLTMLSILISLIPWGRFPGFPPGGGLGF